MDNDTVSAKLESLSRCISRIEEKRPASVDALKSDIDAQDIIVLNLERAIQVCVDIGSHILTDHPGASPSSMAGVFREISAKGIIEKPLAERLSRAVGFRNIAVHEYEEISWDIVFSIITGQLNDFRNFAGAVMGLMK